MGVLAPCTNTNAIYWVYSPHLERLHPLQAMKLGIAARGLSEEIASERRVRPLVPPRVVLAYKTLLELVIFLQALARARGRISREEHIEHVEGHDVQREEANTRSLVHLIHRNNMALRQQQPQLQVIPPPCVQILSTHLCLQRASVELRSERRRFNKAEHAAARTASVQSNDEKKFRCNAARIDAFFGFLLTLLPGTIA
jgi:hypothetical protein